MNKMIPMLMGVVALAGCVTTTYEEAPAQASRQIVPATVEAPKAGPAAKKTVNEAAPVAAKKAVHKTAPVAAKTSGHATAVVKPLRVLVSLTDGNPDDRPSACKRCLQTNIEGELARSGYRVVYAKPAEILVYGTLRGGQLNSRGSRVVWQVTAEMDVTRAPEVNVVNGQTMADVVAKQRFDVKSGEARSATDAQKQSADKLGTDVAKFAKDAVLKVGEKLKACEITITNAWQPQDAAGYPTLFAQRVAAMPGVYACKVISTDNANRTMKAEIIYETASYPDGIINRLYVTPELNIAR